MPQRRSNSASPTWKDLKTDSLKSGQRPRQRFGPTLFHEERHDVLVVTVVDQRRRDFSLDPFGAHGVGCQRDENPVAALECYTDFVEPLWARDVSLAVPDADPMVAKGVRQANDERCIFVRIRQKDFVRSFGAA